MIGRRMAREELRHMAGEALRHMTGEALRHMTGKLMARKLVARGRVRKRIGGMVGGEDFFSDGDGAVFSCRR